MSSLLLPYDIILNILSRLPVNDLLRFRCVCKPWRKLITSPNFVKMHLNHSIQNEDNNITLMISGSNQIYTVDYIHDSEECYEAVQTYYPFKYPDNKVEILCSYNGLVCIKLDDDGEDVICIWNPSTQECKKIPTLVAPIIGFSSLSSRAAYGFGYDCNTEDYKLVRILSYDLYDGGFDSQVHVYSLRSNSWKRVKNTPLNLSFREEAGAFVNGAFHWIACSGYSIESEFSFYEAGLAFEIVVVSFDIGNETFKVVQQPENLSSKSFKYLDETGGCLCIISYLFEFCINVWVMKDYGVTESWTKLFSIPQQINIHSFELLLPVHSFKNGEILLLKDSKTLVLYNPNSKRFRNLKVHGVPKEFNTGSFVRSLVSPNLNITYKKKLKNKKKKNKKRKNSKKSKKR